MTAIATAPQDGEILSLFRQWIRAYRAADEIGRADRPEDELDAACEIFRGLERKILDLPAQGPAGFAVKVYLAAHCQHPASFRDADPAGLSAWPDHAGDKPEAYFENHCLASLMRDAAGIVPEIAELAAPRIGWQPPSEPGGNVVRLRRRKR